MGTVCAYCHANNPDMEKTCVSCGAPLEKSTVVPVKPKTIPDIAEKKNDPSVQTARKIAGIYSSLWLAIADAIIIASVAFTIGLAGGIVGQPLWGIIGAAILGFSVSITIKNGLATLISAPVGVLAGSILCIIAMLVNLPSVVFPIILTVSASITALYGGIKIPYSLRFTWQKARPYLGTAGGILFGLLGMGIGLGLQVVYTNLVQFLQELG